MQLLGVLTVIALIHVIHVTKSEHSINVVTVGNDSMTLSIKQDEDAVQKAVEYCRDIFNTDTLRCIIKIGTRLAASRNQSIDFGSNLRMPSDRVICDKNIHGKRK